MVSALHANSAQGRTRRAQSRSISPLIKPAAAIENTNDMPT